jgi:hypothetical protein
VRNKTSGISGECKLQELYFILCVCVCVCVYIYICVCVCVCTYTQDIFCTELTEMFDDYVIS